jgi:ATP-dependent DNA ligase
MKRSTIDEKLKSLPHRAAVFIEPMECIAVPKVPDGFGWLYEIKLDGYRAIAVKSEGRLNLFSRRRKSFNTQYALVFEALADLPDNTVIDGEVVALDESGRPDFNLLQHYRTQAARIHYFVFDVLVYNNRDLTRLPLIDRHEVMKSVLRFKSLESGLLTISRSPPLTCSVQFAPRGWKASLPRGRTVGTRLANAPGRGLSIG